MNKKGAQLAFQMIVVLIMLLLTFWVWKMGVIDKFTGLVFSMKYQIDTTEIEACRAVMSKQIGPDSSKPTDRDGDSLPDYICDPCICRDGDGGDKCRGLTNFNNRMIQENNSGKFKAVVGGTIGYETKGVCLYRGKPDKDGFIGSPDNIGACGTNSYDFVNDDIDNDFLPDICDANPNRHDKEPQCYESGIYDYKGRVIGYVSPGDSDDVTFGNMRQCIFTLCNAKLRISDDNLFSEYCVEPISPYATLSFISEDQDGLWLNIWTGTKRFGKKIRVSLIGA